MGNASARPGSRRRQRTPLLIVGGVLGGLALAVAGVVLVWVVLVGGGAARPGLERDPPERAGARARPHRSEPQPQAASPAADPAGPRLVRDDGQTLWVAPTSGDASLPLVALPPGVQWVLSVRLADMTRVADGAIVIDLCRRWLEPLSAVGVSPEEVQRLTVGLRQGERYGQIDATLVIDGPGDGPGDAAVGNSPAVWGRVGRTAYGPVWRLSPNRLVIAQQAAMDEIRSFAAEPPLLRREMEELLDYSDATRHATLLLAPSFLFAEGKPMLTGGAAALLPLLRGETPDELRAVMASAHFSDERFYWELRCAAAAELPAARLARRLAGRVVQWPGELQMAVIDLSPALHGRRVVGNLPAMLGVAARYARSGVEGRHAVLSGYLPAPAGHNLWLAADLLLAEQSARRVGGGPGRAAAPAAAPKSLAERLRQPASVAFDRDTLESAVRYLADEIGAPIVILGRDLQLEGITKNQSFAMDARDEPAAEVLLKILRRANPNNTADGPADPDQKLVYVLRRRADGREAVFVTTRAAVARRGEDLPAVFVATPSGPDASP